MPPLLRPILALLVAVTVAFATTGAGRLAHERVAHAEAAEHEPHADLDVAEHGSDLHSDLRDAHGSDRDRAGHEHAPAGDRDAGHPACATCHALTAIGKGSAVPLPAVAVALPRPPVVAGLTRPASATPPPAFFLPSDGRPRGPPAAA